MGGYQQPEISILAVSEIWEDIKTPQVSLKNCPDNRGLIHYLVS